jgi:hypothetical protein
MRRMHLMLVGFFFFLAASAARADNNRSTASSVHPTGMLSKLLRGEARMGRYGVPADATFQTHAVAERLPAPGDVYITDEYGFKYDKRGERVR